MTDDGVMLLQASEMVGVCNVLQTVGDPLSLSLALDIMEEVLHAGDARKYGRRMARDGALAALVSHIMTYRIITAQRKVDVSQLSCLPPPKSAVMADLHQGSRIT